MGLFNSVHSGAISARDAIPVSYNAGFIVLSFLVSLVGCVTTLELLRRRTSRHGAHSWYLLASSSVTMGAVGIWCMHYIGNQAIDLHSSNGPIVYDSGFTAISFFIPIAILLPAFYVLATTSRARSLYVAVAGLLAGLAISLMHYVGNRGMLNYNYSNSKATICASNIIAVCASVIALSIFFRIQDTWTDSWWKRVLCGMLMAGGVTGMHWTATAGTSYATGENTLSSSGMSRAQVVIICTVLALLTCILLLGIAVITAHKEKLSRKRARQLVLASAYFDDTGRIMVTSGGLLPAQKITNSYVERTFGDNELSKTHPSFIWVFQASRNWTALQDLVPGMKHHLETDFVARQYVPGFDNSASEHPALADGFARIFKELFCVAADGLASNLRQPLDRLGVLFEEPIDTGSVSRTNIVKNLRSRKVARKFPKTELEDGLANSFFSKGQFLFVVKRLNKSEVERLAALGYRFARIPQISELVSKSMQIDHAQIEKHLQRMKDYLDTENLMEPGVHLAGFSLRPKIHGRGFDVLVPLKRQAQLPTVPLPIAQLTEWQREILQTLDGRKVGEIFQHLAGEDGWTGAQREFRSQLLTAVGTLVEVMGDSTFVEQATFSAKETHAPHQSTPQLTTPGAGNAECTLLSFRHITTIYAESPREDLTYVPLKFFNAQQQLSTGMAHHDVFMRKATQEFAHCYGTHGQGLRGMTPPLASLEKLPLSLRRGSTSTMRTARSLSVKLKGGREAMTQGQDRKAAQMSLGDAGVKRTAATEVYEIDCARSSAELKGTPRMSDEDVDWERLESSTFVDELYSLFLQDQRRGSN